MKIWIVALAAIVLGAACVPHKDIAYFQEGENPKDSLSSSATLSPIQPSDIISVNVYSLNPEADAQFNTTSGNPDPNYAANTYLVDTEGFIEMPLIGKIQVKGMNTTEAKEAIRIKLDEYLKEPVVNVRFVNFRVTVLGEVSKPGVYSIANERVTIVEALGLAGDLTIYGKRTNVLLIRERDGQKQFFNIDLTSRDLFSSPNYYLQNNDVLYVEPSKGRTSSDDNAYRIIPIVLSSLTFLSVIIGATIQ